MFTSSRSTAVNAAALTHASTPKNATKRTAWHTATKSAFYANFYAVDEAAGALAG